MRSSRIGLRRVGRDWEERGSGSKRADTDECSGDAVPGLGFASRARDRRAFERQTAPWAIATVRR
jgi:hypothetical protein